MESSSTVKGILEKILSVLITSHCGRQIIHSNCQEKQHVLYADRVPSPLQGLDLVFTTFSLVHRWPVKSGSQNRTLTTPESKWGAYAAQYGKTRKCGLIF